MLEVQGLTKQFNEFLAVDDVSFNANGGEIFGLLGPNGAGKTTTIRVIATILEPTSGTARIKGVDITKEPEHVRKQLGLLTADIGMYDRFTARENLRYFGELYGLRGVELEKRIDELIELLDMKAFADRKAGKFSTGMKQKVAIARSVIHDPDVIIFDEPTSGLDVLASQTVISFMKRMRDKGKLVVLSTHDMAHAQSLCDRVAIIHRSKLIAQDSVDEVLKKYGVPTLEEAFIKIVGDNEAKQVERDDEQKHLTNKKSVASTKKKTLGPRHAKLMRYGGIGIMLVGFLLQALRVFGDTSQTVFYGFLGVGVIISVWGRFLEKKLTGK